MVLVGRPGYRINNRTIKRGSQVSILTVSFKESSNLCIFGIIPFLAFIWFYPCEDLELVVILMASSSSSKMDLTSYTFSVYLSWFLFGFYPLEDLELVFISMTSSTSSKTDSE